MLLFFFFNDPAPTEIYTLSLHDALPIFLLALPLAAVLAFPAFAQTTSSTQDQSTTDRKSTRLNSSHVSISYAVFCLKKKKEDTTYLLQNQLYTKSIAVSACQVVSPYHYS